jgi:hypothetical protein
MLDMNALSIIAQAGDEPAGGAEVAQVIIATAGAAIATAVLLWLVAGHRSGRVRFLTWAADLASSIGKLPRWAALPLALGGASLLTAAFGMYWDISLHIDDGRDAGPLANPAHYFILAGLFGIFAAGVLAIALPVDERPGPGAVRITGDWYAPVGGVLMAICGGYSLIAFPLDDFWHRIFGQDVTLWGPTHLMLIGGAGMTLIAQAILLREAMQARERTGESTGLPLIAQARRVALMGGLLIGASTFQGEFDFGVPQFSLLLQPVLIAVAAGLALVAARVWIGPGAALGAALFFLVVRGGIALAVGPILGEVTPYFPLYVGEALCVELAALALVRRPLALGVVGGLSIGTLGFAAEYGWTQFAMPHAWNEAMLPEGLALAVAAGIAAGVLGALLGAGLRGELPQPRVARTAFAAALVAIAALVANGLVTTEPDGIRATVALNATGSGDDREAVPTVRIDPPDAAENAYWLTGMAWQAGKPLSLGDLERVGDGVYRATEPLPLGAGSKALIRLHKGRSLLSIPVRLPEDRAIPVPAIEARANFTRPFRDETAILQRELKDDTPSWIWAVASLAVLALSLGFVLSLGWGLARVARAEPGAPRPPRDRRRPLPTPTPTPTGA